jgi:dipeptidyl aminopeptidase/acylaminoacyl peptidase
MPKLRLKLITLSLFSFFMSACSESTADENNTTSTIDKKGNTSLPSSPEELANLIKLGEDKEYKYSVEDFFRNPDKANFSLSPSGKYFSYLGPYKNRMNLYVQKIGESEAKRITSEKDRDIAGYQWASEGRLIYVKDEGGNENFSLFGVDVDGKNLKELTPFEEVSIQIIDMLEGNDEEIIIGMNKEMKELFEPYRINIITGEIKKIAENKDLAAPISTWKTDHNGRLLLAIQMIDGINQKILYRSSEDEPFKESITTSFKEGLTPMFFDFEKPNVIYALSNIGRDKETVVRFDLEKKKEIEALFNHSEADIESLHYSKKNKRLLYAKFTLDKTEYHFFDEDTERRYNKLKEQFPNDEIVVTAYNREEDKYMLRTYNDKTSGAYYYYDSDSEEVTKLVDIAPWLNERDMADMTPIAYTSRDGLTIHGYLTLPKGVEAKNLPVIIHPHGGPWVRDKWGYNPSNQLLASRGFAVFQMNYRGSTGYGREFWEASFKEWGNKMQNDITDGVNWLISEGIADPNRVAIYGGSYGGYATLAGITFTPELYACAIDFVGVSNLHTFLNTIPPYWKPYLDMMHEMVGHPVEDSVDMANASPVNFVDNITCPLFVVQGANDPRVNIDESDQIVQRLRKRGIEVPYMVKYDEGHGFRNEENRIEFYKAMLGFLSMHLKKS